MNEEKYTGDGVSGTPITCGPFGHDFSGLAAELSTLAGERPVFVPGTGNAGDSLLNFGAYCLFRDMGLDFEEGVATGTYPGRTVIYGGGGNLVEPYPNARNFIKRNRLVCARMYILPSTVRAYRDVLAADGAPLTVFVRERPSYEYLAAALEPATLRLSHDMAFYLDSSRHLHGVAALGFELSPTAIRRSAVRLLRLGRLKRHSVRVRTLDAFREDLESCQVETPTSNFDLSQLLAADDMREISCARTAKSIFLSLSMFEAVRTDRLHVGIACLLTKTKVELYDNNYGKNSSVFERSIDGYFGSIRMECR